MLITSASISSAVVITRVLAEKARCVTIILENSSAISTFEPSTEVGIRSGLREDLYLVFAGAVNGTEEAVYRFNINPLVWWVWFGGFVLAFGGILTMWPGGGPAIAPSRSVQSGYGVSLVGAGRE